MSERIIDLAGDSEITLADYLDELGTTINANSVNSVTDAQALNNINFSGALTEEETETPKLEVARDTDEALKHQPAKKKRQFSTSSSSPVPSPEKKAKTR